MMNLAALESRVQALESSGNGVPESRVLALIDAAFASAVVSGRTQSAGGILSHSHGIAGLAISRKP